MVDDGTIHFVDEARMKEINLEQERQNRIWQKEEEEKASVKKWHVVLIEKEGKYYYLPENHNEDTD